MGRQYQRGGWWDSRGVCAVYVESQAQELCLDLLVPDLSMSEGRWANNCRGVWSCVIRGIAGGAALGAWVHHRMIPEPTRLGIVSVTDIHAGR